MMRGVILMLLLLMIAESSWAADVLVKDGDTLTVNGTEFRRDGVDAPEKDQMCLQRTGTVWTCGIEARDRLAAFIGARQVSCEDKGRDPVYPNRRIGVCSVEGETMTLNRWLVRQGWAIDFEPYARRRFEADEMEARDERLGLWSGC